MKKCLSVILVVSMLFCCTMAFTSCKKSDNVNYSETFAGAISKESYASEEEAAQNFLENEVDGKAVKTSYVGMEKKSDLTETEISELDTGDVLKETDRIVSAEMVEVKYTKENSVRYRLTAASAEETPDEDEYFVVTVYILVVSQNGNSEYVYHYFVPKTKDGDILTKSYYDDLLDPAKYTNFTVSYSTKGTSKTMGISSTGTQTQLIKVDGNTALISIHRHMPDDMDDDMSIIYKDEDYSGYFENTADGINAYVSNDKWATYQETGMYYWASYGITDMNSFITMCLPNYDYSYYVKTDYGFELKTEFLEEILEDALHQTIGDNDTKTSVKMRFYVVEGRLYKVITDLSLKMTVSEGGFKYTVSGSSTMEIVYSDFGTTVVEKPEVLNNN